jgi:hypothetical protein
LPSRRLRTRSRSCAASRRSTSSYGQKTEPVEKAVNCAASVAGPEGTR